MDNLHRFNSNKILAHADRLRAIGRGELPYPIDWHVYPSNVCNHKCTWCMFRQNGEQFDFRVILPREVLLRAVRDAARTGAVLMHFSGGGEPLINKATPEAMALAGELGLKVAMSTNGRLLTPEVAGLVDYIRVSLNAGTPEQHHATNHGGDPADKGDWHVILENIAACAPVAKQDMGLGFVVDYENYQDIYEFCKVAARLFGKTTKAKQRFVHIRPGFYFDAEKDAKTRAVMPLALTLCREAQRDFGDTIDIYAISEKFDGYWTPRTYDRCRAILTGTTLRATGDFAVCQDRTDLVFGKQPSYKAGASFEDVWHSDEHKRVISTIHAGAALDACPRCVWNNRNHIIDAIADDSMRLDLV
jgi:sulfatase maturation enzyme AslB (radical SAM superfamily)